MTLETLKNSAATARAGLHRIRWVTRATDSYRPSAHGRPPGRASSPDQKYLLTRLTISSSCLLASPVMTCVPPAEARAVVDGSRLRV